MSRILRDAAAAAEGAAGDAPAARAAGAGPMLRGGFALAILAAALSLPLGLTLPLLSVDRLFLFSERPSIIDVIAGLWRGGDVGLAAVVFAGSVLFPVAKLAVLHLYAAGVGGGAVRRLEAFGRWSMLDVVLVALIVFSAKTSGVADAAGRPGLWFFGASVGFAALAGILGARIRASETAAGVNPPAARPAR